MIERKITGNYEDVLHKVKVASNNIGFFSFVSEDKVETVGDITICLFNATRQKFFIIYPYYETISIMLVANGDAISLTAIGGGGDKGIRLEKQFEKNLMEYNL